VSASGYQFQRASGVLLHPTCLNGPDGIGDLGPDAFAFVDWLQRHGQSLWQILPLGPTSFGDSPYQTLSSFAGNTLLISLDKVKTAGWLTADDLAERPTFNPDRVEFGKVITWKTGRLARAWENFQTHAGPRDRQEFQAWRDANAAWVEDFALFSALKESLEGQPWHQWPRDLARREPAAITEARRVLEVAVSGHCFGQWLFASQWADLRRYVADAGLKIVGDVPIFVAHDSCDVWANQAFFRLDTKGHPTHVAGVPPDYFSKTGQLWGNPLYDWDSLKADGYGWWIARMRACLAQVDIVRIDHFRGFAACWEVPAEAKTAVDGQWIPGPGAEFFAALKAGLDGRLPLIAEDLGVITADVEALRDAFDLPGMKVLQFAWSGPDNLFLPHEHTPNCVVYSGTHDNDPTLGWWEHLADADTKILVADYVGTEIHEPNWTLIRLGLMSCAHTFIATLQDVLGMGREARMNLPGEGSGNWNWRVPVGALEGPGGERLAHLTWLYRRRPEQDLPVREDPPAPEAEHLH